MVLLDLPPEIFQPIIHEYVNASGVAAAWKCRGVCRAFASYIRYDVLANQPIKAFIKSRPNSGRVILKNAMGEYLFYRVYKLNGAHPLLPNHVKSLIDSLLSSPGIGRDPAQRQEYTKIISEVVVKLCPSSNYVLTTAPSAEKCKIFSAEIADDANVDRLAAAAAVGDRFTMSRLIIAHPKALWNWSSTFDSPLAAAAAAGQMEVVADIVRCYKSVKPYKYRSYESLRKSFCEAVNAAIKGSRITVLAFLLDAAKQNFGNIHNSYIRVWLEHGVKIKSKCTVATVLSIPCEGEPRWRTTMIESAFAAACDNGSEDIVRLLVEGQYMPVNEVIYHRLLPLESAMSSGQTNIVKYLLEKGADPKVHTGHLEAVARRKWVEIVKIMIEGGADPHDVDVERLRAGFNARVRRRSSRKDGVAQEIIALIKNAQEQQRAFGNAHVPGS